MVRPSIVILTGAGISAESGLSTFRGNGGLWEDRRVEEVATPEAFAADPDSVHRFYNLRRAQLRDVKPNAAHHALAELERAWKGPFLLITQNVDDLHDRAGSQRLLHMHGELRKARCLRCGAIHPWDGALDQATPCPSCHQRSSLRPHIVWFGEMPLDMERIELALYLCDLFVSIGTSGNVYPAAGFVQQVGAQAHTLELNLDASQTTSLFHESRRGKATDLVPAWVQEISG
ncbi:MAG: NAD-dependent deacylase [Firmicutes bacterium]|nr:NAD-dependent deacylase [Bacillota bacterium]